MSVFQSVNLSAKNHHFEPNKFSFKRMNSREQSIKHDYQLTLGGASKFRRSGRRNKAKIGRASCRERV